MNPGFRQHRAPPAWLMWICEAVAFALWLAGGIALLLLAGAAMGSL